MNKAFNPPAATPSPKATKKAAPIPAASTVTVDVYNGGATPGLAGGASSALVALGYKAGAVGDASAQSQTVATGTEVFYGAGASANAAKIATDFGTTVKALASLPAEHVEVLLGTGSTVVPAALAPTSSSSSSSSSSPAANNGAVGGAVTVAPARSTEYPACIKVYAVC